MARSTRAAQYVNSISFEELKEILGPNFETAIRDGFASVFAQMGLVFAEALIHGEVDSLCGPWHSRKEEGQPVRWGSQPGSISVDGTKQPIEKPRVRTADGKQEIDLETYAALSKKDGLTQETMLRIGSGVSTREYAKTVRKELRGRGISKSTVSRRVIEATKTALENFLARRWDKHNFVCIMIDGVRIGKAHVIVAVGIDNSGHKHVLGWNLGSTENATACRDLLRKLADAGLDVDASYLFVLDGSKSLKAAVQERFGTHVLIQRCQEHKIRDVEDYLPVKLRKQYRILLQAAYNEKTYSAASKRLQKIRLRLLSVSEPAANSLTEGLEHTLTLHKLGITGGVRESLRTTNIIESTFARLRANIRNVSSWSDSDQVERWLAAGLTKAESGYRRLPGHRQMSKLKRQVQIASQAAQA